MRTSHQAEYMRFGTRRTIGVTGRPEPRAKSDNTAGKSASISSSFTERASLKMEEKAEKQFTLDLFVVTR